MAGQIEMALNPEVQRIVLLDGPAYWAIPLSGRARTIACR
ncbi:transcriptional regulator, TetR family domain protein [Rhizobium leguminosarum bv. viciae]|nr:transcriptional regulator, TetR family domain protein [Rhizobium leguminosarum bv. viciae]